jgi:hypothetical protein
MIISAGSNFLFEMFLLPQGVNGARDAVGHAFAHREMPGMPLVFPPHPAPHDSQACEGQPPVDPAGYRHVHA